MSPKKFILTLSCQDQRGIVATISNFLSHYGGFILEMSLFGDVATAKFFMRCCFEFENTPLSSTEFRALFAPIAQSLDLTWNLHDPSIKPKVLLLVSTASHCLKDLLYRSRTTLPIEIEAVGSNHLDLKEMADWYKIPFHYWPITPNKKEEQERQIATFADEKNIDLLILARYMQILSPFLTEKFSGKAINIHHSFLPSFKGAKPYHQAFDRGVKLIGATAHYVSDDLDEGPIIEQEVCRVDHTHTPTQLVELGRDIECRVLARAIKYHIENRIFLNGRKTVIFQ